MFFIVTIEKVVRIEPYELGKNLIYKIRKKIEDITVGTCSGTYGYIIQIIQMKPQDISDGRIQDTTGDVIYKVKFKALVFRPFRGEVLDGEVIDITDNGFMIESGPLKSFISTMRIQNQYAYDKSHNQFISKDDPNLRITVGSNIRYKIDQIKYDKGEYTAVSSLEDGYLGPLSL
eukprot:403342420